ncbi:MAG: acyltransferase family protein [Rhodospirillales bacterium]|nr:acyltransferase family protein [Rhodospirillales bacterium]
MSLPAPNAARPARRTDLDLIRIAVCAAVILAHALLIFAAEKRYHLKSAAPWLPASIGYEFLRISTMAIFFTLAGWAAIASLRRRDARHFLRERVTRVLLPLVAGILLLGPIIKYIELRHGRDLTLTGFHLVAPLRVSFLTFLPRYYTRLNLLTWSHLWFLAYLFLISLILLPVLTRLARLPARPDAVAGWLAYAPVVPIAVLLAGFHGYWPFLPDLLTDWTNFGYFALCFLLGAAMATRPGFEDAVRRHAPGLALLGALGFAGVIAWGPSVPGRLAVAATAWGSVGAALGLARRFAPRSGRLLAYLSEATLPVYIIHHVIVLWIGEALLPLGWPPLLTVLAIWLPATALSVAAYHWLIRPYPWPRLLTGMGPLAPAPSTRAPLAAK